MRAGAHPPHVRVTHGDGASYPAVHPFVHLQRSRVAPASAPAHQPGRRPAPPKANEPNTMVPRRAALPPSTVPAPAAKVASAMAAPAEDLRSVRIKGIALFFGFWMVVTAMFLMLFLGRL